MIRSISVVGSFVFVVLVALMPACENFKDAASPGYPHCAWEETACRHTSECCSAWCVNGFCERRDD